MIGTISSFLNQNASVCIMNGGFTRLIIPFTAFFNFFPLVAGTLIKYILQTVAHIEHSVSDKSYIHGNCNTFKACTIIECRIADRGNTVGIITVCMLLVKLNACLLIAVIFRSYDNFGIRCSACSRADIIFVVFGK